MTLYKYVTIKNLKQILSGSIRFTQPSAFNDPFELLPEIQVSGSLGKIHIRFSLEAQRRETKDFDLTPEYDADDCNDLLSRDIIKELNSSIGILCLSTNPESLLMWSHYADQYRGALIEFDESNLFFKSPIKVDYRDKRPKKRINYYLNTKEPIPISELCVKSKQWEYENEVRLIRHLKDCRNIGECNGFPINVMDIPIEAIKSVTFGERTPIPDQRDVWKMVKDTNIALYLAAISFYGYEFRKEIIKFNKPISEQSPFISPRTAHIFSEQTGDLGDIARWTLANHHLSEAVNKRI